MPGMGVSTPGRSCDVPGQELELQEGRKREKRRKLVTIDGLPAQNERKSARRSSEIPVLMKALVKAFWAPAPESGEAWQKGDRAGDYRVEDNKSAASARHGRKRGTSCVEVQQGKGRG